MRSQPTPRRRRRVAASLTVLGVVIATFLGAQPAVADTAPVDPTEPVTIAADSLPTVQIDGVAWDQEIVGNTVYVVGKFTTARPAGAAPGVNTVPRNNMLAYNLQTGQLITSFAPSFNAQIHSVSASPDGSRIYVGGDFTQVSGVTRYRIAAFSTATGALITSFQPVINARVAVVEATNTAVYVGGIFSVISGQSRSRLASLNGTTGAVLPFIATPDNGQVEALTLSPDASQIVIGGSFTSVNGSSDPGYGLARLDAATGAMLPLAVNGLIRNGGTQASINSLNSDATQFYGSGYVFGSGGNLEGSFAASWATGALVWLDDCHGDIYDVLPRNDVTYVVGHPHYCGNIGGYPQTTPWTAYYATAFTNYPTGTITRDPYGYFNFEGNPSPTLLNFFPTFLPGTFTGAAQATWTLTGNDQYIVYGGEFPYVNNVRQQGLARMAVKEIAPNKQGPRLAGAAFNPRVGSFATGTARISWPGNYDRDNETLVYRLYRGDMNTVIDERTVTAKFWKLPTMGFVDTGRTPGSTQRYRISATDPFGNVALSEWVSVTIANEGTVSDYANTVLDDSPSAYWRLGESDPTTAYDWAGFDDATVNSGVTRGASGAIIGDSNNASTFDGSSSGFATTTTSQPGTDTFTAEAWIQTTSTSGGKILGFGDSSTGTSSSYDRHVYMDNSGRVWFGVYPGGVRTVNSAASFNDGQWHHIVASLGADGMRLYVDGKRVGQRTDVTSAQSFSGYWRIGGDNLNAWPSQPSSSFLAGTIDDVAIYPAVLTRTQVVDHYVASGRESPVIAPPTDAYGISVNQDHPDLYWRLGETTGNDARDSSSNESDGTYRSGATLGTPGAIVGTSDTAATFNGSDGLLSSNAQFNNPTTYSEELWFNTTTTNGGKLIGLGNEQSSLSSGYDRHIYMETDGRLTFGTWTGQPNTITSPQAYNDGLWHHMVATQSSAGMRLYVDGAVVGTNPQTAAQDYAGFWKVGGDTTWGPQPYFAGAIDEVAVYSTAISARTVAAHYLTGSTGQLPNQLPTAVFTPTVTGLQVAVDGSDSSDADGTVTGFAWDFGDGATATGATASHTYAVAATYTVTLTVTDDDSETGTVTHKVTFAPTDAYGVDVYQDAPALYWRLGETTGSAARDSSASGNDGTYRSGATLGTPGAIAGMSDTAVTFNGSDGLLSSNAQFNNPTTYSEELWFSTTTTNGGKLIGFGNQQSSLSNNYDRHVYMETDGRLTFGVYTGQLNTVTSPQAYNDGQWHHMVATQSSAGMGLYVDGAVVGTNPQTAAQDYAGYWKVGGDVTWGPQPYFNGIIDEVAVYSSALSAERIASHFAVGSSGQLPNQAPQAAFTSTTADLAVQVDGSMSTDADGTIAGHAWTFGDGTTGSGATASHTYAADGTYTVALTVTDDRGGTGTVTHDVTVTSPPPNQLPTAVFTPTVTGLQVSVDGSDSSDADGTVAGFAWDFGDGATATGATASHTYAVDGTYTVALTVTDNGGGTGTVTHDVTVTSPPPNQVPTAVFTPTVTGLQVAVDGSASSDADGTIAGFAWDFGDGATATGATASHTYAAAGTYPVILTVTDDDGATGTLTHDVTVTVPPGPVVLAADTFTRDVSSGWGGAEVGGAWSTTGSLANYSVTGGVGVHRMNTAGSTVATYLNGVSSASMDLQLTVSLDKPATGGGTYVSVLGRKPGTAGDYRAKLRFYSTGAVTLGAYRTVGTTETAMRVAVVPGLTYAAGEQLRVRVQVTGTSPTTVRARVWRVGTAEPATWLVSSTDSTAALQAPGGIGLVSFLSGTSTNAPVFARYDDLAASSGE